MLFSFKYHFSSLLILLFFITQGCQLQDPDQNHGILFLENRADKLLVNKTNKNDVLKIVGHPHVESINDENKWIYIERILSKGKYHKLGRHDLKANNTLILTFDKYGVLISKDFTNKENIKKIKFAKEATENNLSKKSFVTTFLSSIREKMYGNRK